MQPFSAPQVEQHRGKSDQRALFALATILTCAAVLGVFFRDFFASHFNLIAGDIGDNRFCIAIFEHWRAVAQGRAGMTSPNFFWPQPHVLGYSEAMFLLALPYSMARSLGLDRYISFELTLLVIKTLGFVGMLWLLVSFVKLSKPVALIGAVLFTMSNAYYVSVGHAHLMIVALVPLLCALALAYWREQKMDRTVRALLCVSAAAILLGALFFTSFYIAWFTALVGATLTVSVFAIRFRQDRRWPTGAELAKSVSVHWIGLVLGIAFFALTMVPFIITYLPTLKQTGGRSFQELLVFSPQPIDVINVGPSNWVWGKVFASTFIQLRRRFGAAEMESGWPILTLLIFAVATIIACWRCTRGKRESEMAGRVQENLLAGMGITVVMLWLVSIKVGGHSLWWLVLKFVPGGSAIRVPARLPLVLNILVVIVVAIALEQITNHRNSRLRYAYMALGAVMLVADHFNVAATHQIRRDQENAILSRVKEAPRACRSFLATNPVSIARSGVLQLDAMLVARELDLPTINGYSGWVPPEWRFGPFDVAYLGHARRWVISKGIEVGLCGCDLETGAWSRINAWKAVRYELGEKIDFRSGGNAGDFEDQGWSVDEPGGTWTLGNRSALILDVEPVPSTDLVLEISAHAFAPPQRPQYTETLAVNTAVIAEWQITGPLIMTQIRIPRRLISSRVMRIEFGNSDPKSPADVGLSGDTRKIGLALESMRMQLAGQP
jgi:hypothetical protein